MMRGEPVEDLRELVTYMHESRHFMMQMQQYVVVSFMLRVCTDAIVIACLLYLGLLRTRRARGRHRTHDRL